MSGLIDEQELLAHEGMNDLSEYVRAVAKFEIGDYIADIVDGISLISTMQDLENKPTENDFSSTNLKRPFLNVYRLIVLPL